MMQLMPATAQGMARRLGLSYAAEELDDADYNMRLGSAFLGELVSEFSGSYVMAAAAYNAGPGRPRKWREGPVLDAAVWVENIPFPETRDYVKKVLSNSTYYASLLGGKGTVYYMRGIAGNPADSDRDIGFKNALKNFPNIKVVPTADGVATGWDPPTATKLANEFIASGQYDTIQGIWTSGIDSEVVDAIKAAGKPFVPIVGTDRGSFIKQLLDPTGYPDLKGVAVTNTAAVGGAGVNLALKLLNGEFQEGDTVEVDAGSVAGELRFQKFVPVAA